MYATSNHLLALALGVGEMIVGKLPNHPKRDFFS